MKKRLTQFAAFALVLSFVLSIAAPSTALAKRRHHRGWHWYPPIITGHIINRPCVPQVPVVYDYNLYRQNFINSLDDEESALFIWLEGLSKGRHIKPYGKDVTKRRLKKIISALYQEYRYIGVQDGCIHFDKL